MGSALGTTAEHVHTHMSAHMNTHRHTRKVEIVVHENVIEVFGRLSAISHSVKGTKRW